MKTSLICYVLPITLLLINCNAAKENASNEEQSDSIVIVVEEEILSFPDLQPGEVFLKDKNPFGETIELTGRNYVPDTTVFKVREAKMNIVRDKLVLKNYLSVGETAMFRLFNYPDLTYIRSTGNRGNGPGELFSPIFVPSDDSKILGYIFDVPRSKLYKLSEQGDLEEYPFVFKKSAEMFGSIREMYNIGIDDFVYTDNSSTGKSIMRSTKEGDTIVTKELISLQLNPKRKSPFTYIGDFGINKSKNRMVYAYKYFKILKFIDLETLQVRTINFQQNEFDENTLGIADGLDNNTTHYWGISSQNDYVYCMYSGRKPVEVIDEWNNGLRYIYVEQYDWNGNPVAKYKLDQSGYFTVDEKNNKLILLSTGHDDPFFIYELPSKKE